MFSQVCVCPGGDPGHWIGHMVGYPALDMGSGYPTFSQRWDLNTLPHPPLLTCGAHTWRLVQTCLLEDLPPPPLTPRGDHRNTYGWQAGGTHPTGILSYFI